MKLLPSGFCLALVLAACHASPTETAVPPPPSVNSPTAAVAPAPTTVHQLSHIISGYWVAAKYLEAVARTRSPEAASNSLPDGPLVIFINPTPAAADSMRANVLYNMHEGGEMTEWFQAGRTPHSVRVKLDYDDGAAPELTYFISPTDTTLTLVAHEPKRLLKRIAYRRILGANSKVSLDDGLHSALNKILVAGSYAGTDSVGRPVKASFSTTGRVAGLPFSTYLIQADFIGPSIGDELIFDSDTKQRSELAAVFGRDTLRLYTIHESVYYAAGSTDSMRIDSAYNFQRGRLRYQLVRTRKP